jgi:hypothetical protein
MLKQLECALFLKKLGMADSHKINNNICSRASKLKDREPLNRSFNQRSDSEVQLVFDVLVSTFNL